MERNDEFTEYLHQKIMEYNKEFSLHHSLIKRQDSTQPINMIVMNRHNKWVGGMSAELYSNWLEIVDFWFAESYRGIGIGTELLNKVESIARKRGADYSMITTFEFQARAFYEEKGYKIVGELKDYPPGSSFYTMVKGL
ncbi:GNAT family N-acetyltransferase [Halobacillus shinanisalinarum]|uniref:GNAT family N-acetyltransferase n=1 Tax=Halobacillus shinanisalinarum TaxID=2932258 RepID=A0ABY4GWX8_9BACI|nr:GNAT family N-acetyltransferase [Halobacillus shinanisalinarum]UOQ92466.1 GNAT family N-acetyltransferase [Halobacillus shinanisalinarum]